MRKVFLSTLFLVVVLGIILIRFLRHRGTPHNPVNITGGLTFEIPYEKYNRFYLTGLSGPSGPSGYPEHTLHDFITNQVSHELLDSTQVLYDGELVADSGIVYSAIPTIDKTLQIITLHLYGDLDPKKIRGFMRW